MKNESLITVDDAALPKAVLTSQRPLAGEMPYPVYTRFRDWRAGRRDRALLAALLKTSVDLDVTPWMQVLRDGLLTALARNHRETITLQAPLRTEAAVIVQRYIIVRNALPGLDDRIDEERNAPLGQGPATSGESFESEDEMQHRRVLRLKASVANAKKAADDARAELNGLRTRHAELTETFDFHADVGRYRAEALRDMYAKRQDLYVHSGLKGQSTDGRAPHVPTFEPPAWPIPHLPQVPTEH